jgi:hypothetical protein
MRISGTNGRIEFCTFSHDSAKAANGGAVRVGALSNMTIANNTFYQCYTSGVGSALLVSQSQVVARGNVMVQGRGAALAADVATIGPGSGCNLLWENTADYFQWPPEASATDVHADPEFCDPEGLDFTVHDTSPAAAANSGTCGQIGAHGVGCGSVSIEPSTWGRVKQQFRSDEGGMAR